MKLLAVAVLVVALSGPAHTERGLTPCQFQQFVAPPPPAIPPGGIPLTKMTRKFA